MPAFALALGILGTLCAAFPGMFWLGIPLVSAGLYLAGAARRRAITADQPTAVATAALVTGVVGLVLGLLMYAACATLVTAVHRKIRQEARRPASGAALFKPFSDHF